MMNINDYINGQRRLRELETLRASARMQYTNIVDMMVGDTEYDGDIKVLVAELDEYAGSHRNEIDSLYRQYGAHKADDGYYYQTVTETSYSELFEKEVTYKRDIPFSLVDAICKEV